MHSLAAYAQFQGNTRNEGYELLVRLDAYTNVPLFVVAWRHQGPLEEFGAVGEAEGGLIVFDVVCG